MLRYSPATAVIFATLVLPFITFAPTLLPNTGAEPALAATVVATSTQSAATTTLGTPLALTIPSIDFDASVIEVGLNNKGEMDVPSGTSSDVGWYKYGTEPGEVGSAVIDAHVYAAFKDLDQVEVGDSIYVTGNTGEQLHFVVEEVATTKLEQTSAARLFNRIDKARLNLITCAGTYVASRGTYDHRLVVYAVLVGV